MALNAKSFDPSNRMIICSFEPDNLVIQAESMLCVSFLLRLIFMHGREILVFNETAVKQYLNAFKYLPYKYASVLCIASFKENLTRLIHCLHLVRDQLVTAK